jgi:2-methylcitrate dehydratase PrpD
MARNGWAGHGAMAGFTAVEMARAGIGADEGAPFTVLHECLGYPVNEREWDNPWTRWAIHDGYHKSYACCQYTHSAVEASLELARGPLAGVAPERITSIVVSTHPLAMPLDDISPTTVLGGKFSVPHTVAAVLARATAAPTVFSGELLDDPAIARLRALVAVEAYEGSLEPPFDRPARVRVTLDSGESHVAECRSAEGGPDRPLTDEDVLAKAELLTARSRPGFAAIAAALVSGELADDAPWADALEGMWAQ